MKKRLSPKKVEEAINRSCVNSDSEKTLTISSEVRYLYEASRKSVKFHFRISYPNALHSLLKMVFGEKCFEGCNLFACH